jgi:prephenate dehydratase
MDFLKKYPHIKLVEDKDTAETAEESRKTVERIAAIASKTASLMYDLKLLRRNQTIKNNMTRFVIIKRRIHLFPKLKLTGIDKI